MSVRFKMGLRQSKGFHDAGRRVLATSVPSDVPHRFVDTGHATRSITSRGGKWLGVGALWQCGGESESVIFPGTPAV